MRRIEITRVGLWARHVRANLTSGASRSVFGWVIRPTTPGAWVGLAVAAYVGSYTASYLLGAAGFQVGWTGLTFWFIFMTIVWSIIASVLTYIATAHLFGVLAGILFKFLTKTAGSIAMLVLGIALLLPYTPEPENRYQQTGGLVFLTSPSVSKIEVDMSLDAIGDVGPLLNMTVTVDGKGPATIAVVGSGPAEFNAAAMTVGSFNARQVVTNEAPVRTRLPAIELVMPLVDASELVEIGDEGMRLGRGEMLSAEVSGNWFSPDSAEAFHFDIQPADADVTFSQEVSFMLRLSDLSTANLHSGNLGQIGCPTYLVKVANNQNGGKFADQLFSLPRLKPPLTVPEICEVRFHISQVSNATVHVAGSTHEITTPEKITIKGTSAADELKINEAVNTLTLPRTDWSVGETEEKAEDQLWDIRVGAGLALVLAGLGYLYRLYFKSWLMRLRGWVGKVADTHTGAN